MFSNNPFACTRAVNWASGMKALGSWSQSPSTRPTWACTCLFTRSHGVITRVKLVFCATPKMPNCGLSIPVPWGPICFRAGCVSLLTQKNHRLRFRVRPNGGAPVHRIHPNVCLFFGAHPAGPVDTMVNSYTRTPVVWCSTLEQKGASHRREQLVLDQHCEVPGPCLKWGGLQAAFVNFCQRHKSDQWTSKVHFDRLERRTNWN